MSAPPVVSVGIAAYNQEACIGRAIEGALAQCTRFPFEIVIGEDGSTDRTAEVCRGYARRHPDLIRLEHRSRADAITVRGRQTARHNVLETIRSARGRYVAWCDGDDYWCDPDKLERQVTFLEAHPEHAISHHPVRILRDGRLDDDGGEVPAEATAVDLAYRNFIHVSACVFRNVDRGNYPAAFRRVPVGDYALHLLNARHGRIHGHPEAMAVYRVNAGTGWDERPVVEREEHMAITIAVMLVAFDGPLQLHLLHRLWQKLVHVVRLHAAAGDPDRARAFIDEVSAASALDFGPLRPTVRALGTQPPAPAESR